MPIKIPCTLYALLLSEAERHPDANAIESPGKPGLTYLELSRNIHATALQLTRMGMHASDRLAVVLPNGPEMAVAFLAISAVCTCAPLNPAYLENEFRQSMEDLKVRALVTSFGGDHPACKAASGMGIAIIQLEPDGRTTGSFNLSSRLPMQPGLSEPILAGIDQLALVLQTSGTTSRPKTVPITHRNIFHSVHNIAEAYALSPSDRCLNMMPLFHIHGLIAALGAALASGGSVVCTPGFLPSQVLGWLTGLKPTWYTAVPTMHQSILEQIRLQPELARQVSLRFIRSCSSSLPPQVGQDLEAAFGVSVLEAYGMTEGTHQIASNPLPPRQHKFGSVGQATGTTRICILDEAGKTLPADKVGEICIRGANVIAGYENNQVSNAVNFSNGWLRTGDTGSLDTEGYLFIQGRIKELINRGGEKISPREVDEVLLRHPAVRQAVAFAVPHPSLGEDVGAAVVVRENQVITVHELRQFAAASLSDFKVPRQIVFLNEIPKGPTGKIQRIGLADKLKGELEALAARQEGDRSEPPTELKSKILSIWQQVLGRPEIGVRDDFLSLGGESIQAARILLQVNESFGTDLQIIDLMSAFTVTLMAELVQTQIGQEGTDG